MKNRLTEHFSLDEFTRSATAAARGIVNEAPVSVVSNLQHLCQEVLEPLRRHFDRPIIISSGYRCTALNQAVGGAPNSQHRTGEAADIHLPDLDTGLEWFFWIQQHCIFDQLLFERRGSIHWIHVSCRRHLQSNRFQVRFVTVKKTEPGY